jgi:hypothetical protein
VPDNQSAGIGCDVVMAQLDSASVSEFVVMQMRASVHPAGNVCYACMRHVIRCTPQRF